MFFNRFGKYFKYLYPVQFQFATGLIAGLIHAASSEFDLPLVIKDPVLLGSPNNKPNDWMLAEILLSISACFLPIKMVGKYSPSNQRFERLSLK